VRHLLNTLYVTTEGAYLARDGETITVRVNGDTKLQVPIHTICSIVCFGQASVSTPLMGMCAEKGVALAFLTETGRFLARIQGPVCGNVLLRKAQYRKADNPESTAEIARSVVIGKVANCRTVLLRAIRDRHDDKDAEKLKDGVTELAQVLLELSDPIPLEMIRGKEGQAANTYFGVFNHLVTCQKEDFFFQKRSRRPPLDNLNALLSFLYTLLVHDAASALETVGLDPAVGFLHAVRPGRPSLALDLVEEFRPYLADRLALSLINRQQIRGSGFRKQESGSVLMDEKTRKAVLVAWQERKREQIIHPFLKEKIEVGLLPYVQALLLARHIRGELDAYPTFFWK
jgi:CRISPR-associated protein Cas1